MGVAETDLPLWEAAFDRAWAPVLAKAAGAGGAGAVREGTDVGVASTASCWRCV